MTFDDHHDDAVTDARVAAGLAEQLRAWRAAVDGGAARVGWKIGFNAPAVQEMCGIAEPVIGHLTSSTVVEPDGAYAAGSPKALVAEGEVAVELGADVAPDAGLDTARAAIAACGPAIELVDIERDFSDLEAIVAENVFHRAVVFGPMTPGAPPAGLRASVRAGAGDPVTGDAPEDFAAEVQLTARLLGEHGELLRAGDRIITGALAPPPPAAAGDRVELDLGALGSVAVAIS